VGSGDSQNGASQHNSSAALQRIRGIHGVDHKRVGGDVLGKVEGEDVCEGVDEGD
jgi:hypothetical protein